MSEVLKMDDKTLSPLLRKANPTIFQLSTLPSFFIPPENFDLWTDQDEREFEFWQAHNGKQNTKDDYMDFLHNINKEFNMDEVFSKLEEGLEALEKLESCMNLFPNYDLKKDLEESYVEKENGIVKKFIKTGISFVRKNSVDVKDFVAYMKTSEEACDNTIDDVAVSENVAETSVAELSQFGISHDAIKTPAITAEVSEDCPTEPGGQPEVGKEQDKNVHLGQVDSTIITPKMKTKRRNKEQRLKRLLKFQEKLVRTSGLPPSRLMEQKNTLDLFKRNIQDEFKALGSSDLTPPAAPVVPLSVVPVQGQGQGAPPPTPLPGPQSYGSSSSFNTSPMLCSMTPSWTGGFAGVTSTPGWPDARPVGGFDSNSSQSSLPYIGSSSGSSYQTSLSSSSQYGMGLPNNMLFQSQPNPATPAPPVGTPAYCFHCLQYGSVFTLYPV